MAKEKNKDKKEIKEEKIEENKEVTELEKIKNDLNAVTDKYTRLQAEFINYQTRTQSKISGLKQATPIIMI